MKKILLSLLICIGLTGCAGFAIEDVKPSVAIQYKTLTLTIPDEILDVPAPVQTIDVKTSTQKSVAKWLTDSELRTKTLENKLLEIKRIQAEQLEKQNKENK